MVGVNEERAGADQSVRLSVVLEPVIFLSKAGAFEWMLRAPGVIFCCRVGRTDGGRDQLLDSNLSAHQLHTKCVYLLENGSKL